MHKVDFSAGRRIGYLMITVILAIMSGALGFALFLNYFSTTQFLSGGGPSSNREVPIVINVEQPLISIAERSSQYLVRIVRARPSAGTEIDAALYATADFVGVGIVLTSDGWIMTSASLPQSAFDVIVGDASYATERIMRDSYTGLTFVKIPASGLRPVQISAQRPAAAEVVFSSDLDDAGVPVFYQTYITRSADGGVSLSRDGARTSDSLDAFVGLADRKGTIFFSVTGDLSAAWSVMHGAAVPARHIDYSLSKILSSENERSLGITYVLDAVGGGALVRKVELNSIAAGIGIQKNDRITGVNADVIDISQTFSDVWRKYQFDDSIKLTVVRGGRIAVLDIQR